MNATTEVDRLEKENRLLRLELENVQIKTAIAEAERTTAERLAEMTAEQRAAFDARRILADAERRENEIVARLKNQRGE